MFDTSLKTGLALGLVAAFALSAATPSFAQTQRQRPAASRATPDDPGRAFGQAQRERTPSATDQSQCWISRDVNDHDYGYMGPCTTGGARPTR
jgi:hypothetical protein